MTPFPPKLTAILALMTWADESAWSVFWHEPPKDLHHETWCRHTDWIAAWTQRILHASPERGYQNARSDIAEVLDDMQRRYDHAHLDSRPAREVGGYRLWWQLLGECVPARIVVSNNELVLSCSDVEACHHLLSIVDGNCVIASLIAIGRGLPAWETIGDWPPIPRLLPETGHIDLQELSENLTDTHLHIGGCSISEYLWHGLLRRDTNLDETNWTPEQRRQLKGISGPFDTGVDSFDAIQRATEFAKDYFASSQNLDRFALADKPGELNHFAVEHAERVAIVAPMLIEDAQFDVDHFQKFHRYFLGKCLFRQGTTQHWRSGDGLRTMVEVMSLGKPLVPLSNLLGEDLSSYWHRYCFLATQRDLKAIEVRNSGYDSAHELWQSAKLNARLWQGSWSLRDAHIRGDINGVKQFSTLDNLVNHPGAEQLDSESPVHAPPFRYSMFVRKDLHQATGAVPQSSAGLKPDESEKLLAQMSFKQTAAFHEARNLEAVDRAKQRRDYSAIPLSSKPILHRLDIAGLERFVPTSPMLFAFKLAQSDPTALADFERLHTLIDPSVGGPWQTLHEQNALARHPELDQLSLCIHAGEEFRSPLEGLAAIGQLQRAGLFSERLSLGHGLILGEDVAALWRRGSKSQSIPAGTLFESLVWLNLAVNELDLGARANGLELTTNLNKLASQIYGETFAKIAADTNSQGRSGQVFSKQIFQNTFQLLLPYERTRMLPPLSFSVQELVDYHCAADGTGQSMKLEPLRDQVLDPFTCAAWIMRQSERSDRSVSEARAKSVPIREYFDSPDLLVILQKHLLAQVADLDVQLEFCPTSNSRVTQHKQFHALPTMNALCRKRKKSKKNQAAALRLTLNTDDPGTFCTRIENELALVFNSLQHRLGAKDLAKQKLKEIVANGARAHGGVPRTP